MAERNIKKEIKIILASCVVFSLIILLTFNKSSLLDVLRMSFSIYWMFVIPGYVISLIIDLDFVERFIIGVSVQTAVFGIVSYYCGLLGWHVSTHGLILPLLSILAGGLLYLRRK